MSIQAILFDKSKFTTVQARAWLKKKGYKPIKRVHITKNLYRYRLKNPKKGATFRNKKIKPGITLILEFVN